MTERSMPEKWTDGADIARFIDHTLLKPFATSEDIAKLCAEAAQYRFRSVCVNGSWVSVCKELLAETDVGISAVVGFPLGASATRVKAHEAAAAVDDGATEIDMVMPIGAVLEGRYGVLMYDVSAVVRAVEGAAIVKVILETGYLDDVQKAEACRVAEAAGAHYVKTSTGFGAGGATVEDVLLMRGAVTSAIGVKASGGIRDAETAVRMLRAGANRLGTSAGVAIVSGRSSGAAQASSRGEGPEASLQY